MRIILSKGSAVSLAERQPPGYGRVQVRGPGHDRASPSSDETIGSRVIRSPGPGRAGGNEANDAAVVKEVISPALQNCHGLGQVAWLVAVSAERDRHRAGEVLQ